MQLVGRSFEEGTLLRVGHAYERASGWWVRRPSLTEGQPEAAALQSLTPPAGGPVDPGWVMRWARLAGLGFLTEADAGPIAASIAPVKALLGEAGRGFAADVEPALRPAPTES
jgi:aspartyl-tRNA(Asn)/glutamyl-tRNA(Gln) amidotransferase subunit A